MENDEDDVPGEVRNVGTTMYMYIKYLERQHS
jgi:hypothetical protein